MHLCGSASSAFHGDGDAITVCMTTLPKLMQDYGIQRVDLLKLDCEGAEWDILPTAEDVLPRIRQICMEFHCRGEWTPAKLANWLRVRGYEVWHTAGPWNGLLWASRPQSSPGASFQAT